MKIEPFALERWLTAHELNVEYDIAESGIYPLTTGDLLDLIPEDERSGELQRLLELRLGYSEATGTRSHVGRPTEKAPARIWPGAFSVVDFR